MATATTIFDYVGRGVLASRPASPNINSAGTALYYATDGTPHAYIWNGSAWVQIDGTTTIAGSTDAAVTSPATDDILAYVAAKWTNKRPHYAMGFSAPQVTVYTNSQVLGAHRMPCGVTIPANFGTYLGRTSKAGGSVNATGSSVFNVDQAATATPNTFSNIGTITIAAGSVTPTFATSGGLAIVFAAGDVMRVVAPSSADATLVGFYATIIGYET